jgi:alpha-amylase
VDYVLVDDRHFGLAGLDPEAIGGYYLTEEQGTGVAVFPINQRLRYLIPFSDVEVTLDYLQTRRGHVPALTMVDDGEKFGVWPGTHRLVYEQGWLDRFFDRLLATPWLELRTFSELLDTLAAAGSVYLPTASYREMGEWALPLAAARQLESAGHALAGLPEGAQWQALLRGGFWRNFLVKYPEVGDIYWKMLRLSQAIAREAERGSNGRLHDARLALWRGQANDAYWHGVFGGCYLPHLRRAVKQALLEAERRLDEVTGRPAIAWERGDLDGDGREEIVVRTRALVVTLRPEEGGMLTELGFLPCTHDAADVLARRPELYHDQVGRQRADGDDGARTIHAAPTSKEAGLADLLQYDPLRRGSLLDGLFAGDATPDPVAPWTDAQVFLGRRAFSSALEATAEALTIHLTSADPALTVDKRVTIHGDRVTARYRVSGTASGPVRWGVQWNLALTAGEGGRYLDLEGRPPLRSQGRRGGLRGVALVDEWAGLVAELTWSPEAELGWGPVETVSVSESGFERIYQGTALLVTWALSDLSWSQEDITITLTLTPR